MSISERRACRALGQHRSTQRKTPRGREDEEYLTADLIELARQYGRYGYRKITALLRDALAERTQCLRLRTPLRPLSKISSTPILVTEKSAKLRTG